ncbi:DUF6876 family protein [Sinomicrobium sp. M5D2P17]
MEVTLQRQSIENKNTIIRKHIEAFKSSGKLYMHPDFPFYYTDGVKYVISLFEANDLLRDIAMQAFALSGEENFICIHICRGRVDNCWVQYSKRSGELLKKVRVSANLPLEPGISICFYFIGRTLLLATEF